MKLTPVLAIILVSVSLIWPANAEKPKPLLLNPAYGDSEFRLGPDDVLEVFVWKEPELSTTVVVRPDGKVSLPLIGELLSSGKTATELQKEVTIKLAQYISEPVVNVIVKEVNSAQISVLGEVKNPGMYKIKNRATVVDALALAGGFTEYAKRSKVTVIRSTKAGEQKHFQLNVNDQIKGSKGDLFYVQPYDKIYVQ
jgi:polysaccharide biosynthesis/export protein